MYYQIIHGNRIYHYEIRNDLLQVVLARNNSIGEKTFKTKRRDTYINDPNSLFEDVHPSNSLLRNHKELSHDVVISQVNHLLPGLRDEDADHM